MDSPISQALPVLASSLSRGGVAEDLLRALTEHTPVGVFLSDTSGACRFVNRRWCELTGLSVGQALGSGWAAALHPDDRGRVGREWAEAATAERDSIVSYRFRRPDGSVSWIDGYASAFRDANGRLVGWVGSCLDVTSHRRSEMELRVQAHTDPLTGLPNRRAFNELLEAAVVDADEGGEPVSLILLDLDRFKQINDVHGHPTGDDVLVAVAGCLQRRLRREDLAARLGGDEFAVLARTDEPARLAELLVETVRSLDVRSGRRKVAVRSSAGSACASRERATASGLFAAADDALYRAKRQGRDRTALVA